MILTEQQTRGFQMLAQKAALKLEIAGMKHSSGKSMAAHLKRLHGFKGNKQRVLEQFEAKLRAEGILV